MPWMPPCDQGPVSTCAGRGVVRHDHLVRNLTDVGADHLDRGVRDSRTDDCVSSSPGAGAPLCAPMAWRSCATVEKARHFRSARAWL